MSPDSKTQVQPPYPIPKRFPSRLERTTYRSYNWIENRLWPVKPPVFVASLAISAGFYYQNPENRVLDLIPRATSQLLEIARFSLVSFLSAYVPVFVIRYLLKNFYFSYKGFLFENPKKPSTATKAWGLVRKILSISPPILESCDRLLPNLPVPALCDSIEEYLDSMKHILPANELATVNEQAEEFLRNEGRKLQRYAYVYSLLSDNYVTPFWQKFAYLYGRYPLLINSSVAHCDFLKDHDATRAHRAARVVWIEFISHLAVDRQQYKPLGDGLVCTRHYRNMYAVNRVPGETVDHLNLNGIQKHVIVFLRGKFYKIDIVANDGTIYSVDQLTKIFHELIERNESENGIVSKIAALTHDNRDSWCKNREKYFLSNPTNRETLKIIESAIVFFSLDENDDYGYEESDPSILSGFQKSMLTGNGTNRWVDKSLNYICSKNAKCGGTTEHSIADGAEFDHIMENFMAMDIYVLGYKSVEKQEKIAIIQENEKNILKLAEPLRFEIVDEKMSSEIERCYNKHLESTNDVDIFSLAFRDFGKGRIKKCGVSPDAFIQMAIQLAIYRDQGKFVLTYEPASVRFFANSRTETLRTVNDHSCEFVYAMLNENESKEKRIELLKRACETHVTKNKKIMVGKGIDRHLFVLYILSKATGISSPFLESYISQKWTLSTSHVPNVTNQIDEDSNTNNTWLGACFGAVAQDGYGVCYRFGGNHGIFANISSYHSAENTSSSRFADQISRAFHDLSNLFD